VAVVSTDRISQARQKGESMEKGKISAKQQEILEYIKNQILDHGYPPAVREICAAVNLKSTSSVHSHLATLEKNGYIRRDPTKPRAIEIVDDEFNLTRRELRNIPIIGEVAAGQPILAEQNIAGYFPVSSDDLPSGELFVLKVRGESMINVGIYDGDQIFVQQTPVARNGDIVVALVEDSATVKTYYKEEGRYRLQPENDTMDPIYVDEVVILGKVVGLFRRM
jgi:repressor LexA